MDKFYCNGKKGFCDTYDDDITANCYDCIYHDETGYCPVCGQALDWSDTE